MGSSNKNILNATWIQFLTIFNFYSLVHSVISFITHSSSFTQFHNMISRNNYSYVSLLCDKNCCKTIINHRV